DVEDDGVRRGLDDVDALLPAGRVLAQQQPNLATVQRSSAVAPIHVEDPAERPGRGAWIDAELDRRHEREQRVDLVDVAGHAELGRDLEAPRPVDGAAGEGPRRHGPPLAADLAGPVGAVAPEGDEVVATDEAVAGPAMAARDPDDLDRRPRPVGFGPCAPRRR